MDHKLFWRVVGTTAGLGFFTSCLASLSVCFVIADSLAGMAISLILLILGVLYIILSFYKEEDKSARTINLIVSFFCLITCFVLPFVPSEFHLNASYTNRAIFYFFPLFAIFSVISINWTFVTSFAFSDVLQSSQMKQTEEKILYVTFGFLFCGFLAFSIPMRPKLTNDQQCSVGIINSIAFWFLNSILSGLIGYRIMKKQGGISESIADYNQVGK